MKVASDLIFYLSAFPSIFTDFSVPSYKWFITNYILSTNTLSREQADILQRNARHKLNESSAIWVLLLITVNNKVAKVIHIKQKLSSHINTGTRQWRHVKCVWNYQKNWKYFPITFQSDILLPSQMPGI